MAWGGVEGDEAGDDQRHAAQLERGERLAERGHADERDGGGAGAAPDRVGDAEGEPAQREREEEEGERVADDDDGARHGAREALRVAERDGGRDLGRDCGCQVQPDHSGTNVPIENPLRNLAAWLVPDTAGEWNDGG